MSFNQKNQSTKSQIEHRKHFIGEHQRRSNLLRAKLPGDRHPADITSCSTVDLLHLIQNISYKVKLRLIFAFYCSGHSTTQPEGVCHNLRGVSL